MWERERERWREREREKLLFFFLLSLTHLKKETSFGRSLSLITLMWLSMYVDVLFEDEGSRGRTLLLPALSSTPPLCERFSLLLPFPSFLKAFAFEVEHAREDEEPRREKRPWLLSKRLLRRARLAPPEGAGALRSIFLIRCATLLLLLCLFFSSSFPRKINVLN